MPQTFPLVNGVKFDFSSIEAVVAGMRFQDFKAINYKYSLKPTKVRGTNSQPMGRTRGQYEAEGSLELYTSSYQDFILMLSALGKGFMEQEFDLVVNMQELATGPQIVTDLLRGCRISDGAHDYQEGTDALSVKVDLDVMYIRPSLLSPLSNLRL